MTAMEIHLVLLAIMALTAATVLWATRNHQTSKERIMHYRNGHEAKNGDTIVSLNGGTIEAIGVLHNATPGNDYCNGKIAPISTACVGACMCDCLHIEDVATMLKEKGLDKRPSGK